MQGRRKLYLAGAAFLLVLILLISIPTTIHKINKSTSSSITTTTTTNNNNNNNTTNNNNDTLTFANRNSTKEDVFQFLKNQEIYLDISIIEQNVELPQHRAAAWLSREDNANLKVPHTDADEATVYKYLVRYVMALIFYSFDGPNHWRSHLKFMTPTSVCTWQAQIIYGDGIQTAGIFCDETNSGIPNELKLISNNLKGTIPTEIGLLTSLTSLGISFNDNVTGTIPTNLCTMLPLKKLDLSWNALTGNIPPCIGTTMSNLQWLYLSGNVLKGTIPTQMGKMTQLQGFIIEDNMFTGNPIPVWNGMTQLKMLYASQNNFTGFIDPYLLPHHKSLEILDLSHNQFTYNTTRENNYTFPHHLLTLFNLTHLDLSNNPLQGTFPRTLFPRASHNKVMVYFSVTNTQMHGEFPDLHQLNAIKHLDLSRNDFHGTIPLYHGENNTSLELLYLSENSRMSPGTIPSNFARLSHLRDLSLRNTNLQGTIPAIIGTNLTNLVLLDLGMNNFTSPLSANLANLKKLEYLLLNGNIHLGGGLHPVTTHHPNLKLLLIDGTKINIGSLNCQFTVGESNKNASTFTVYTDCLTPTTPPCACCKCCTDGDGFGCSNPLLASIDASWLETFDRTTYTIIEYDGSTTP